MIHHFNCPWNAAHVNSPLIFDWDDETGEVTGKDAEYVLGCFAEGQAGWGWRLTSTKNRTDIAAVIGERWRLPPDFVDDYPKYQGGADDNIVRDESGTVLDYMNN